MKLTDSLIACQIYQSIEIENGVWIWKMVLLFIIIINRYLFCFSIGLFRFIDENICFSNKNWLFQFKIFVDGKSNWNPNFSICIHISFSVWNTFLIVHNTFAEWFMFHGERSFPFEKSKWGSASGLCLHGNTLIHRIENPCFLWVCI